jgi:hypothetical protein
MIVPTVERQFAGVLFNEFMRKLFTFAIGIARDASIDQVDAASTQFIKELSGLRV